MIRIKNYLPLLACVFLFSCTGGGTTKKERKKMPELNSLDGGAATAFTNQPNELFPFKTGEVEVMTNGVVTSCYAIDFQDAGLDSMALDLLNNYKPLALPLLQQWAVKERKGVLIDLRRNKAETNRADYVLDIQPQVSIPVIFLWDRQSSGRAASWITVLQSSPVVHCRQAGSSQVDMHSGRSTCF